MLTVTFPAWQTALHSQQEQRAAEAGRHHQRLLEELSQQRQAAAEAQRAAASTRCAAEARQKEMAAEISNLHSEVRMRLGHVRFDGQAMLRLARDAGFMADIARSTTPDWLKETAANASSLR